MQMFSLVYLHPLQTVYVGQSHSHTIQLHLNPAAGR